MHDVAAINKTSAITYTHTDNVYWIDTWHVAEDKIWPKPMGKYWSSKSWSIDDSSQWL